VCLLINVLALMGQFYVALYPVGGPNLDPETFFTLYLAGPFLLFLYLIWKSYSWFYRPEDRPLYVKIKDIDLYTGMRQEQLHISGPDVPADQRPYEEKKKGPKGMVMRIIGNVI
jgi:amino acid transporter